MAKHKVVIAALPDGEYGTATAAMVMKDMLRSFPKIRLCLMVGIGGGAPSDNDDIRLGDVVVSTFRNGTPSVVQYDFGKEIQHQPFQQTGYLNGPPMLVRTAITTLKRDYKLDGHGIAQEIDRVLDKHPRLKRYNYNRPDKNSDRLYRADVIHKRSCGETCTDDPNLMARRDERGEYEDNPVIHYGPIASANRLMKDATRRDELVKEKGFLCFEMEAGGLMNQFPCLVVRGICDYADTHKNKGWQGYAALTAATYAKDLLRRIHPLQVEETDTLKDIMKPCKFCSVIYRILYLSKSSSRIYRRSSC